MSKNKKLLSYTSFPRIDIIKGTGIRDKKFEQMCLYEMTCRYKKLFKVDNPSKHKDNEGIGYKVKGANKYKLKESHPGYKFSHLTELKHPTIPKISLPRDKLCPIEELDLHSTNTDEVTIEKHNISLSLMPQTISKITVDL